MIIDSSISHGAFLVLRICLSHPTHRQSASVWHVHVSMSRFDTAVAACQS